MDPPVRAEPWDPDEGGADHQSTAPRSHCGMRRTSDCGPRLPRAAGAPGRHQWVWGARQARTRVLGSARRAYPTTTEPYCALMARRAVAVWQMAPTVGDPRANLARLADAARAARAKGATILVTPELSLTGYDIGALSDDDTDPGLLDDLSHLARKTGLALVVGLALRQDGQTWNCSAIHDSAGDLRGIYRKMHLFGDLDRTRFSAGDDGPLVVDVDGIRVGTLICYDIEFPEPARLAALAGAHLLAIPTANMTPWHFVNEHVIPVRAYENQFYLAYANHHGTEGSTAYVGCSTIAAPDGATMRAGTDGEAIVIMPIDTEDLERRRTEATYLTDRRPELYHRLTTED